MKLLREIIYIIIILLIAGLAYFIIQDKHEKLTDMRSNYEQELSDYDNKIIKMDRHYKRRFARYETRLSKLSDSLKIKPQRIKEVVTVEVHSVDTIRDTVKIHEPPPDYSWETFTISDECFTISVLPPAILF